MSVTYRCFYCDRTTADERNVIIGVNGLLCCRDCFEWNKKA